MRLFPLLLLTLLSCQPRNYTPSGSRTAWTLGPFRKADALNPILQPLPASTFRCPASGKVVNWEARNVLNPTALVRDGKVMLLYRAQDSAMTSRIGLAESSDGLHFTRLPEPVFYPDSDSLRGLEWPGGVEDPRVVELEGGTVIMTYTAYDGKTARLMLASSPDLRRWTKHGPVLGRGKYADLWSKSGAIVSRLEGDRIIATRVNGKYWMYFGDTDLFMASSADGIHWTAEENAENGKMISVLHPRPGFFDSRLVEPGPYALLQDAGILLLYNGSNAASHSDTTLPRFTYGAGQALFDRAAPYRLLDRTTAPFLKPDQPYERVGEVNEVTFIEGLVRFKGKWFLYYGTADRQIAAAVSN